MIVCNIRMCAFKYKISRKCDLGLVFYNPHRICIRVSTGSNIMYPIRYAIKSYSFAIFDEFIGEGPLSDPFIFVNWAPLNALWLFSDPHQLFYRLKCDYW